MMDASSPPRLHVMAGNYLRCLADFPPDLKPTHLAVPPEKQLSLFAGLSDLRSVIAGIYQHFANLPVPAGSPLDTSDDETCWKAIEDPLRLLWALGKAGEIAMPGAAVPEAWRGITAVRADVDAALLGLSVKNVPAAFDSLQATGFRVDYRAAGDMAALGYKKSASVAVSDPQRDEPFWRALKYYAGYFRAAKNGLPIEVFLRADFRPLLPGYTFTLPHLPADAAEIERTLDPSTLEMWREIGDYTAKKYPKYQPYYRVPRLRLRGWGVDYSATGKDYGLWSLNGDEGGLRLRLVPKANAFQYLLDHIDELTPRYQEVFLNASMCRDCTHCGKHRFFSHGDHVHKLCKGPWFYSPYIEPEDVPDVERIIDVHLTHLR